MKNLYLLFICLMTSVSFSFGQNREVLSLDFEYQQVEGTYRNTDPSCKGLKAAKEEQETTFESQDIAVSLQDIAPFLSVSMKWQASGVVDHHDIELQIRTSVDAQNWEEWKSIHTDGHAPVKKDTYFSELMYFDENTRFIQTRIVLKKQSVIFKKIDIHLYSPGITLPVKTGQKQNDIKSDQLQSSCPCDQPNYLSRNQWCPGGNCPPSSNPASTSPTHLIVHHSAGVNSSSDWAAVVRSIWDYHVNVNNWDDIGYNWLIDRNGAVYEGRGAGIRGAHFCGNNTGTQGNCILGNFNSSSPSNSAYNKAVELLAWQSCQYNINPTSTSYHGSSGFSFNNIAGHQQGCGTECPGSNLYSQLGNLRAEVSNYISDCGAGDAACLAPTNLSMSSIGTTTAAVSFNDPNNMNGNDYTIALFDAASGQLLGVQSGLTDINISISGLSECTSYEARIVTDCNSINEVSDAVSINFTTSCNDNEDIFLTNVAVSSTNVNCGDDITMSCTQNYSGNQLDADLPSFDVDYYLSTNTTFDNLDILLGGDASSLGSDDTSHDENDTGVIPTDTSPGTYYVLFVADSESELAEVNENNNIEYVQIEVSCSGGDEDIFLTNIAVSSTNVNCGDDITMSCTQNYSGNQLDADLPSFDVDYYLSTNTTFDNLDILLGGDASSLGSDDTSHDENDTGVIPTDTSPGTYYVLFVADSENELAETNENNNIEYIQIQVTCAPTTYTVSVTASPSNGGTTSGGGTYTQGSNVTITASTNSGWTFTNWTENGAVVSNNSSYTFTITSNRNLVANFSQQTYTVSVTANPNNGGTVTGGGTYTSGSSATVTANANSNWTFTNWTENGAVVYNNSSYLFTATSNRSLVANFAYTPPPPPSACRQSDSLALVALYQSTNGINWGTNWPLTQPISTWHGITLNAEGCVTHINLNQNNLVGTIPAEIGNLSALIRLNIYSNKLSGSIPVEIGNLSELHQIWLFSNQLSGELPSEIGNLSNLTHLGIGGNQLTGTIPSSYGNLSNLSFLTVKNNNLSGCFDDNLLNICAAGNDSGINTGNSFDTAWSAFCTTGDGGCTPPPPPPSTCRYLDSLVLVKIHQSTNGANWTTQWNFATPIHTWYGIALNANGCVTEINLSNNNLTGTIPPEIGQLAALTRLNMHSNNLSSSIPSTIGNLSELLQIWLFKNQLSGMLPPEIGNLSNLTHFGAGVNQLAGTIPGSYGNLSNLGFFTIPQNQLSGCFDANLVNICDAASNANINSGNNFDALWSDFCANEAGSCSPPPPTTNCSTDSLTMVDMYYATNGQNWTITWNLNEPMNTWYGLILNADGCVEQINLPNNNLVGTLPTTIGGLSALVRLNLHTNQLSGSIPTSIGNITTLEQIWLFSNQMTGTLPPEIGNLSNLTHLGLGLNQFTGGIPASCGNLSNLGFLALKGNNLSGCYDVNLANICDAGTDSRVSSGNNFSASWSNFCTSAAGCCNCRLEMNRDEFENDSFDKRAIILYPNPAKNTFHITGLDDRMIKQLIIFDMSGKVVQTLENPSNSIDVSNIVQGMYVVKATIDSSVFYRKIIIKK